MKFAEQMKRLDARHNRAVGRIKASERRFINQEMERLDRERKILQLIIDVRKKG